MPQPPIVKEQQQKIQSETSHPMVLKSKGSAWCVTNVHGHEYVT